MSVLYEMTIFLSITLIAIVATVFVIAASLLGRAIEESSRKQEEIVKKESSEFDETIAELQKQLKGAKKAQIIEELKKQISEYETKKSEAEKELKRISRKYGLLTVKGTVLYPGMFFLVSIVLAGVARYIATLPPAIGLDGTEVPLVLMLGRIEVPIEVVTGVLWGLALLALALGSYRICQCLKVIESVAITTEEAQFKRTTQAFMLALDRHEESKRPKLELKFLKGEPPFSFKPDVEGKIDFDIILIQGDVARSAEVWFFAPEGFGFPGTKTWEQDSGYSIPKALTTSFDLGNWKGGMTYRQSITIKAPSKTGEYILGYSLKYEGSLGELSKFKVKVE